MEARYCVVLDSACSSTVCGSAWINTYIDSLDDLDKNRVKKTINSLKDFKIILRFPALDLTSVKLMTFTDASLGNLNDGVGSTQGVIIWIIDMQGKCFPLFWQAQKIRRVVRYTLAAEALSLQEGMEASFYYRHVRGNFRSPKQIH